MPLYIGDYLRDTLGLSRSEHGSYMLLIMAYWTNGKPLEADDQALREIAKCPEIEWSRTRGLMLRFFKEENGFWTHKRIDEELEKSRVMYAKKTHQTAAALRARGIVTSNVTLNVTGTQPQPQPQSPLQEQPPPDVAVDSKPKLEWCLDWVKESRKSGSDYTIEETKSAFLALNAGGWMWGRNPIVDFRSALERQIQTDRQRNQKNGTATGQKKSYLQQPG